MVYYTAQCVYEYVRTRYRYYFFMFGRTNVSPELQQFFFFFLRFQHTPVGSPPAAADAGAALRLHIGNRYCAALPFVVLFYCCCVGPVTSQTTAFSLRFLAAGYSMFDLVLVLSGIFAVCVFFLFLFWPPSHTALLPLHALLF